MREHEEAIETILSDKARISTFPDVVIRAFVFRAVYILVTSEQQDQRVSQPKGISVADPAALKGGVELDPLGNTARFTSTVSLSQMSSPAIEARKRRYALQNLARKLLPNERIRTCHRDTIPGAASVDVVVDVDHGTAGFRNLQTCNSVWACPVCAAKISEKRREELSAALVGQTYRTVLVTYTLRHHTFNPLVESLAALKNARARLKSGRWFQNLKDDYGWLGSVTSYEPTWSPRNGWHPHAHELVLLPADISDVDLDGLTFKLKMRWLECLADEGATAEFEHGIDVTTEQSWVREYITKYGHEPAGKPWTAAREVTKSVSKSAAADGYTPWQLLESFGGGDQRAGALFQEYFYAFKGSHQLQWAPGTRELLGLVGDAASDEELAALPEPGEPLVSLAYEQWRYLLVDDHRGQLLTVASAGDIGLLEMWFGAIGLPEAVIKVDFTDFNSAQAKPPPTPARLEFGMKLQATKKR